MASSHSIDGSWISLVTLVMYLAKMSDYGQADDSTAHVFAVLCTRLTASTSQQKFYDSNRGILASIARHEDQRSAYLLDVFSHTASVVIECLVLDVERECDLHLLPSKLSFGAHHPAQQLLRIFPVFCARCGLDSLDYALIPITRHDQCKCHWKMLRPLQDKLTPLPDLVESFHA